MTIEIDIDPVGKPRMTRRDVWKKRPCVLKYRAYKDELRLKTKGFKLYDSFKIAFFIPFPKSYSKKKRKKLLGKPHQVKPDIDNLIKGIMDFFCKEDSYIHCVKACKVWGEKGKIIIKNDNNEICYKNGWFCD